MIDKFKNLIKKSGLSLFIIRLPIRSVNLILNKLSTIFWKYFVKKAGRGGLIEFGVNIENPKQVVLGDNIYIGKGAILGSENNEGICTIGNNVHIGRFCKIDHTGNVDIEDGVLFSQEATIFSHSHGYNPHSEAMPKPQRIAKYTWIGYRVTILESTTFIASSSIIAAGSIVTKQCNKSNAIYAGLPAKFIKKK